MATHLRYSREHSEAYCGALPETHPEDGFTLQETDTTCDFCADEYSAHVERPLNADELRAEIAWMSGEIE